MKGLTNKLALVLLCSAFSVPMAHGVIVVTGGTGTTAGQTSNYAIINKALATPSGMLVLTTTVNAADATIGNSNNAIMYINRPTTTDTTITASGIAANSNLRNVYIPNLALVNDPTTPGNSALTKIVVTPSTTTYPNTAYLLTTTVGTPTILALNDANGAAATSNIMALAGGNAGTTSCAFAAVKATGSTTAARANFAATVNDGIVPITISNTTLAMTAGTGKKLDTLSATWYLNYNITDEVTTSTSTSTGSPVMAYDEDLQCLYVGLNMNQNTDTTDGVNNGVYSVAIFSVNPTTGALTQLIPCTRWNDVTVGPLSDGAPHIIGEQSLDQTEVYASAQHIGVMTSSNGPLSPVAQEPTTSPRFKYLIVNGGNNSTTAANAPYVWAIPLVVGNETQNGQFADVTTAEFGTPASGQGDLYITTSAAALVGNGPLPVSTVANVADMVVSNDAVYVSIGSSANQGSANTPGIWASEAQFDQYGKIAYWTEWHRVAPTAIGALATGATSTGRTGLIAVDAVTGNIAAVDGANKTSVRYTQWQDTSYTQAGTTVNTSGLIYNLNQVANVGDACTAVCDLNSTSTAWGNLTPARLALFGGRSGKVCFAMTGSAWAANSAALVSTNTALEHLFGTDDGTAGLDYSSTQTLLLTTLPTDAGTVRALSYSGWYPTTGSTTAGFFFAGAETTRGEGALYIYAQPTLGNGYNYRNMGNLIGSPFVGHTGLTNANTWQELTNFDGIPMKIEAQGGAVYILSRKPTVSGEPLDRIFRVTRSTNAAAVNATMIVTATAGTVDGAVDLSAVNHIYDFVVTKTGAATEQLTMLTDDGIYTTTCALGCDSITFNNNPADAQLFSGWTKVTSPETMEAFMLKFFQPTHTRNPETLWASQWEGNTGNTSVYNANNLVQYGRPVNSGLGTFGEDTWLNFAAYSTSGTVPAGLVQLPVVTQFYSDGLRRLYTTIVNSIGSSTMKAYTVPYEVDASKWNVSSPTQINASVLSSIGAVYWIRPIAGTLMMGTSNGVLALQ